MQEYRRCSKFCRLKSVENYREMGGLGKERGIRMIRKEKLEKWGDDFSAFIVKGLDIWGGWSSM